MKENNINIETNIEKTLLDNLRSTDNLLHMWCYHVFTHMLSISRIYISNLYLEFILVDLYLENFFITRYKFLFNFMITLCSTALNYVKSLFYYYSCFLNFSFKYKYVEN